VAWPLLLALGVDGTGVSPCRSELFRVARSTNANVVVYETRRRPDGVLESAEPLAATWLMLAEDGRRESLTGLERALAYGIDARAGDRPGEWVVTLRAATDRLLRLRVQGGCPVALTEIGGREAVLRLVYVEAVAGLLPQVGSVILIGDDVQAGVEVREVLPGDG
jgi:hypothetical protein